MVAMYMIHSLAVNNAHTDKRSSFSYILKVTACSLRMPQLGQTEVDSYRSTVPRIYQNLCQSMQMNNTAESAQALITPGEIHLSPYLTVLNRRCRGLFWRPLQIRTHRSRSGIELAAPSGYGMDCVRTALLVLWIDLCLSRDDQARLVLHHVTCTLRPFIEHVRRSFERPLKTIVASDHHSKTIVAMCFFFPA